MGQAIDDGLPHGFVDGTSGGPSPLGPCVEQEFVVIPAHGYTNRNKFLRLKGYAFARSDPRPNEIAVDLLFCGVWHTDVDQVGNKRGNMVYSDVMVVREDLRQQDSRRDRPIRSRVHPLRRRRLR